MASNNKFLKLSNAGIQMGLIIGGFAWLGNYLDNKYQNDKKLWTVILSLLGVAIGIYIIIKEVMNLTNNNDESSKDKQP